MCLTHKSVREKLQRIVETLKEKVTLAYVSFCAFVTRDFEMSLLPFQSESPVMQLIMKNLINKFIR